MMQLPPGPEGRAPLSARSVVASLLLGHRPPEMPVRQLVRTAELFGISPGTTRVAISRMVAAGELEVADGSRYGLAGHLLERRDRQESGRHPTLVPWDGTWDVVAVVAEGARPAAARAEVRARLRGARAGELREGVWTRPANLAVPLPVPDGCLRLTGSRVEDDAGLAARLWPLPSWQAGADALVQEMADTRPGLDAGRPEALAPAFAVAAAVVRHLAADPLLPEELLPARWPGAALRMAYDGYERSVGRLLQAWYRADGDPDQPGRSVRTR